VDLPGFSFGVECYIFISGDSKDMHSAEW